MAPNKLRNALLLRLLVPMCAILFVSGIFTYWLALSFVYTSKDRSLGEDARALFQQIRIIGNDVRLNLPRAAIEMFEWDGVDRQFFRVDSEKHGLLASDADIPLPKAVADNLKINQPQFYDDKIEQEEVRIVALRVALEGADDIALVRVATTVNRRKTVAQRVVLAMMAPQLALVLVAVFVIWRGVKTGLSPLDDLAAQLGSRRPDDMVPLGLSDVPAEVVPLIEAFNGVLRRLSEAADGQQRFIADAAHQLRTPLAALKAQINWAIAEPEPAAREAALQQLAASVNRAARLSNQLLMLARAEPNGGKQIRETVDLRALAFDTGSQWVARALHQGRDLGFAGTESPAMICGDRMMLGELISNLLDNAMRYGGNRITLRVDIDTAQNKVALSVEDNGPGIPQSEHERVFERFHRVPGSPGDGSGLGLAIVREIARNHDAEISLAVPGGGGMKITVVFPTLR